MFDSVGKSWKMKFEWLLWCIISETPHTPLSALSFSLHIKMHSYIWVKINVSHCAKERKKEKKSVELRQEANYTLCSRQDGRLSWNYKLSKYNIHFTFARLSLLSDENKRKNNVHEKRMLQKISTFNLLTWRKILKIGAEMEQKRVLVRLKIISFWMCLASTIVYWFFDYLRCVNKNLEN